MIAGAAETGGAGHVSGEVLDGRYRLVRRLGRGGFGDVWQAEELLPGGAAFREVALKLLTAGVTDEAYWSEEAKLLASFRHPSLVTIYAAGILTTGTGPDGRATASPFVAMELLIGSTLADAVKARGRIPWRRVLRWSRDIAAALDVIHQSGVVHLDLKPANLFVGDDDALKVLDFGIARRAGQVRVPATRRVATADTAASPDLDTGAFMELAEGDAFAATRMADERTTERAVVGTPGFMAPEIFERGEPSAATDAYALAVCVVQLATGRLPHAAPDEPASWSDPTAVSAWWAELRRATMAGALRDFAADPAGLPPAVVALIVRLLSVDPDRRRVVPGGLFAIFDEAWQRPFGVTDPPYPGLRELCARDEGMLFGRDDDLARIGRELEFDAAVVLHGARRVGKSSLAAAGLVPYLARRATDGKDDWVSVRVRPGGDPDRALASALASVAPELAGASFDALAAFCAASPLGLAVVVDPLDELLVAPEGLGSNLSRLIQAAAEARAPAGLRVIGVLGEERVAGLLDAPAGASLRALLRYVSAPAASAMLDVVARPGALAGAKVSAAPGIAAEIVRELRADGSRLVFAALALRALWDRCHAASAGGRTILDRDAWTALGGVVGAVTRRADAAMKALGPGDAALAEEILLHLSTTDGAPVVWAAEELLEALGAAVDQTGAGARREALLRVLGAIEDHDLVRRQAGEVRVAHEALLTGWKRLVSARLSGMERILFRDSLRDAAIAWDRAGSRPDLLWSGALLEEAGRQRTAIAASLSPREREFLRESRRRELRQRAVRWAALAGALLAAVLVLVAKSAYDDRQAAAEAQRRDANEQRYLAEVVAKSRRTDDPFQRVAWIEEALAKGSTDGMLPLDLARTAEQLPRARFLTEGVVTAASFPWDDRWLIGKTSGPTLALIDLVPSDPDVVEGVDLDFDPEKVKRPAAKAPRVGSLRPHADAIADVAYFAFDTSFVTRSVTGEVRVFRLRHDGTPALAAIAPLRCAGPVHLAASAAALACATDEGIARWDLRKHARDAPGSVERLDFQGAVLDVSPDGARVAAAVGRRVMVWTPREGAKLELTSELPVVLGRFGPRDAVIALVETGLFEIARADVEAPLLLRAQSDGAPAAARWSAGGLDLAVCNAAGDGAWYDLRSGLAAGEAPPDASPRPCDPPPRERQPRLLASADDAGPIAGRVLGPHPLAGGYRLPDGRILSHDLVLFESADASAGPLLRFRGRAASGEAESYGPTDSVSAVARDAKESVAFQIGGEVRIYEIASGKHVLTRPGNLLGRCDDGRMLAWSRAGDTWRVFDARSDATARAVPREPGFVVGADAGCTTLYTQRLDGALVATGLVAGDAAPPRVVALADGYLYDARGSRARGDEGPGILFAASSGAVGRIDDRKGEVRIYGYATPRATAVGDGPAPFELAYADASGVFVQGPGGAARRVLETSGGVTWEAIAPSPDGASLLLAASDRMSVLDLAAGEIVGTHMAEGLGRLAPWDDEGASMLAWSYDRIGGADGLVVPRGRALARSIALAVSNLEVREGKLALRR